MWKNSHTTVLRRTVREPRGFCVAARGQQSGVAARGCTDSRSGQVFEMRSDNGTYTLEDD